MDTLLKKWNEAPEVDKKYIVSLLQEHRTYIITRRVQYIKERQFSINDELLKAFDTRQSTVEVVLSLLGVDVTDNA